MLVGFLLQYVPAPAHFTFFVSANSKPWNRNEKDRATDKDSTQGQNEEHQLTHIRAWAYTPPHGNQHHKAEKSQPEGNRAEFHCSTIHNETRVACARDYESICSNGSRRTYRVMGIDRAGDTE